MTESSLSRRTRSIVALHITDCHLFAGRDDRLLGVVTGRTLAAVLDDARRHAWPPDVVLATGDLSQDGSPQSYRRLHGLLDAIGAPVLCLPGNHDQPELMALHLDGGNVATGTGRQIAGWQFVALDDTVAGEVGGHLDAARLRVLERALSERPDLHTVVCLHHQPVPTGSRWLDGIALDNPQALFDVTDRFANVRAIVWGHVHQEFCATRNEVKLLSAPATCFQFKPGSSEFALDERPPGYRILRLAPDGEVESEVRWLPTRAGGDSSAAACR